ncbi:DUF4283 domain-containing protein [Artemisia annua]|uniref:DUF4283 domain-containing protein n=1 Tax=Artemisia annua TaxID=35608 RepID=A0A2U1MA71_ARTAN|nr:DUF4283 domain-containing protein [Artemisia annua]
MAEDVQMESWRLMEGRLDFARVLVEIEAVKGFKDKIVIQYKDSENNRKGTKEINVEYDWKPTCCKECRVFGHDYKECEPRMRFMGQRHGANGGNVEKGNFMGGNNAKNKWKVREQDVEAMRRSANKYAVLESHEEEERQEVNMLKDRKIVDMYLNKKEKPTKEVLSNWSKDMANYFNKQWEIDRIKEREDTMVEIDEVSENNSKTGKLLVEDEIQGKDKTVLN